MICVLTLFGETDLQPVLNKFFAQNNLYFLDENCNTSVQLTSQAEIHKKEADVAIIYANAMNMDIIEEYISELREYIECLRVILILSGSQKRYLRSQINDYRELNIDLIFDNNGFDAEDLIGIVKKGKLSHKELKKNKRSGFSEDIDSQSAENGYTKNIINTFKKDDRQKEEHSFATPDKHFAVGLMNAARGAGATGTANMLAEYFAVQKYKTCIADLSGTGAIGMLRTKNVVCYTENIDIDVLRETYNVVLIDFGTPIEITPDGNNFKLTQIYGPDMVKKFTECDIKLIMGFSDSWNIEKINFFFTNDTWHRQFDNSYLFIVPEHADRLKVAFPDFNILNRNDDFKEMILEVFRREEV